MRRVKVWDLPVRLFHWVLVLLIAAAWATQEFNYMDQHVWCGEAILALLLFRIVWGFIGSDTARFGRFLRGPAEALRHLSHITKREADREIGHNAAGGWMVLVMLALVGVQACTGLFSNSGDDGTVDGPLKPLVSQSASDFLSDVHSFNFDLIEAAIVLHVVAIVAYAVLKRQDLVRPMVTGTKSMPGDVPAPRLVSPVWAAVVLAAAACVVAAVVRL
jgi:cytochrome b